MNIIDGKAFEGHCYQDESIGIHFSKPENKGATNE
jgi:hypothetical protein